jgi:hypothetical protein
MSGLKCVRECVKTAAEAPFLIAALRSGRKKKPKTAQNQHFDGI